MSLPKASLLMMRDEDGTLTIPEVWTGHREDINTAVGETHGFFLSVENARVLREAVQCGLGAMLDYKKHYADGIAKANEALAILGPEDDGAEEGK